MQSNAEQIKEERNELINTLKAQGYAVLDTVFDDYEDGKTTPLHYLAKSIEYLANADILVCMKGWEEARGCRIEEQCAREYGKAIMHL